MTTIRTKPQDATMQPDDRDVVLAVDQVSKKFCRDLRRSLFYGVQDIASDLLGGRHHTEKLRSGEFWALKDVSFQLRRGEALGLVGANGAGKSTLLRIISGLIKPDTGSVMVEGRIAPLIALGAGFNPILTGRENIYANMSVLGLSTRDIKRRFDDVVDFAEIWDAIDAPVQSYSSGMAARLGFACAVHIEPDVLLIDEVLAVGDVKFKVKCHQRLGKLRENGTAFVLVSHNPHSVLNICNTSIYLSKGRLLAFGDTESIIRQYEEDLCLSGTETATGRLVLPAKTAAQSTGVDITALCFKNEQEDLLATPGTGDPAYLSIECNVREPVEAANVNCQITALAGEYDKVLYLTSASDNELIDLPSGHIEIQMQMPYLGLKPGVYSARISVRQGVRSYDIVESFRFTVKASKNVSRCLFYQPRSWKTIRHSASLKLH